MKGKLLKIVAGLVLLGLIILVIFKSNAEERPFNAVELSNMNPVFNDKFPSYYDTVVAVAMDQMGIVGFNVMIEELSDDARGQFDGKLKAHVRYIDPSFYLFTEGLSRRESIEVLCHEVIHMQQYISGDLVYGNNEITWKGQTMALDSKEYENRPWENDAFERQSALIQSVEKVLWSDN